MVVDRRIELVPTASGPGIGVLGAGRIGVAWNLEAARICEPAKQRDEKDDRPEQAPVERCAGMNDPHAEDEANADPKAEGADANRGDRMVSEPCGDVERLSGRTRSIGWHGRASFTGRG